MLSRSSLVLRAVLLALAVALLVAACEDEPLAEDPADEPEEDEDAPEEEPDEPDDDEEIEPADPDAVTVGSANFPESVLLAEMFTLRLQEEGVDVEQRLNIGAREVYFPALQDGELDVLPEYTGALLAFLQDGTDETDTDVLVSELREELEPEGISVLEPSEAQNRNSLVVTPETAEEYDLETVSDLAPVADELVMGGPPEYRERRIGLPGLEEVYGIEFADFVDLDPGGPLTIEALDQGDIDVAAMFTTQGVIGEEGWVVLEEDEPLIPAENIIAVVRDDTTDDAVRDALQEVTDALTTDALIELNRRIEVEAEDPDLLAEEFLREQQLID